MYPLFVATAVVLAAGTHHLVVSAGGMQLKHRSSVRVHGGIVYFPMAAIFNCLFSHGGNL